MRIGICGTQCAGKSTLIEELSKTLQYQPPFIFIREIAITYPEERRKHIDTQYEILEKQMQSEDDAKHFISDRTIFDNIAYCMHNYETHPKTAPNDTMMQRCQEKFMHRLLFTTPYDIVFFVDEYFMLPGERKHEAEQQRWVYKKLKSFIPLMEEHCGKFITIRGTTDDRIRQITKTLKSSQ